MLKKLMRFLNPGAASEREMMLMHDQSEAIAKINDPVQRFDAYLDLQTQLEKFKVGSELEFYKKFGTVLTTGATILTVASLVGGPFIFGPVLGVTVFFGSFGALIGATRQCIVAHCNEESVKYDHSFLTKKLGHEANALLQAIEAPPRAEESMCQLEGKDAASQRFQIAARKALPPARQQALLPPPSALPRKPDEFTL